MCLQTGWVWKAKPGEYLQFTGKIIRLPWEGVIGVLCNWKRTCVLLWPKSPEHETPGKEVDDVMHWNVLNWGAGSTLIIVRAFREKVGAKGDKTGGSSFPGGWAALLVGASGWRKDCRDVYEPTLVGTGILLSKESKREGKARLTPRFMAWFS